MDIGSILGTVFSGGITGLLGAVTQRVFEYKSKQLGLEMQKQKLANDVLMKQADAQIMAQEWAQRTKIAQTESQDHQNVAEAQAFSQALTSEPQRYSDASRLSIHQEWIMVGLDLIRGLVRPVLTIYLCVLTTLIYFEAKRMLGNQALGIDQEALILKGIIDTVLYLTTTCVLFWFGTRNKEKPPRV